MMQLCVDARMISCSGIGTVLKNVIPAFPKKETLLLVFEKDIQKEPWLQEYPVRYCRSPIYSIQEHLELSRLVPSCRVFWSPHYNVPLLPLRARKRMVTLHDAAHLACGKTMGWKKRMYARFLFQQAALRSDLILTSSYFSQQELGRYLNLDLKRIHVVYPGVDLNRFESSRSFQEESELRKKYALPHEFFLFIGNLKPHKNLRLILDVYEHFGFSIPTVVVGKEEGLREKDPWVDKARHHPLLKKKILVAGVITDAEVPHFYRMASGLIFPSLYEGFGLPPLEAMACGCPVIASNLASLPEVCGSAACCIDPKKPEELFLALHNIQTNSSFREGLKQQGWERAQRFSWQKTTKLYTGWVEQLSRT